MSQINDFVVARDNYDQQITADEIAMRLVAGERVCIEPVGEVYLHIDKEGLPQVEFVLENPLIEAVFTHQSAKLKSHLHQVTGGKPNLDPVLLG